MSDKKVDSVNETETGSAEQEMEYVPRRAYQEVSADLHKFKNNYRELKAQLSEYEAKLKAQEESKLKEQQKWQELYERERKEKESYAQAREKERQLYVKSVKLAALKNELGGKIKDDYLVHARLDHIEIDETGMINSDTLREVANHFRQEHSQLIPREAQASITSQAARGPGSLEKPISEMTLEEKRQALIKLGI